MRIIIVVAALLLASQNLYAKMATAKDYLKLIAKCESNVCTGKITQKILQKNDEYASDSASFYVITYNKLGFIIKENDIYNCNNTNLIDLIGASVVLNATSESLQATILECAN